MILATRHGGDVEIRAAGEWGSSAIPSYPNWAPGALGAAAAGPVTGMPAVMAAIRLNADTLSSLPLLVYQGAEAERTRARTSWQWGLLHDEHPGDLTTVNLFSDISTSLDVDGNFFGLKVKDRRRRVLELLPLAPQAVDVRLVDGEKVFAYRDPTGGERRLGSAEILHIRGFSLIPGALRGMSPLEQHRRSLAAALSLESFQGQFFRNSARLGGVIKVPGKLTEQQAQELLTVFEMDHAGQANAGSTAVLHSGAEWQQMTLSQQDAQYVESRKLAIGDVARIFRVPVSLLDDAPEATSPAAEAERYLKFGLGPRLKLVERAFAADEDLFAGSDLYPEFLVDALLRASTLERYQAYLAGRQGGWLTSNEPRGWENLPPIEGGDVVMSIPVGGGAQGNVPAEGAQAPPNGRAHLSAAPDTPVGLQRLLALLSTASEE